MRRLMLLRHAKTETDSPSGRDRDRRLDARGHRDAAEIGGWIGRHPPFPDLVQVSPAVRAQQTWEFAWEAMKEHAPEPVVEALDELYGADPAAGSGLTGLFDSVDALGGRFAFESPPQGGTRISIELPLGETRWQPTRSVRP